MVDNKRVEYNTKQRVVSSKDKEVVWVRLELFGWYSNVHLLKHDFCSQFSRLNAGLLLVVTDKDPS